MSLLEKKKHRRIVIIFSIITILSILPTLILHSNEQPKVVDIMLLEILFGVIQEIVWLLKNYTK